MPVREYQRILREVSRLSETDRARLIKELALRARKARKKPDLSKTNETVAYVEGIRMAESRHPSGVLKTPKDFLAELEAWEG